MRPEGTKCPHAHIEHCPLYTAAHVAGAGGCDDGRLDEGGCAADRGMDYHKELKCLEVTQFELVAECEFAQRWHERNEQRKRNLRAAGLH